MMRYAVLISMVCMAIGLVGALNVNRLDELTWKAYKSKYNKVYADPSEDLMRMKIFLDNKQKIEHHNANLASKMGYHMGHNQFSDRRSDEVRPPKMGARKAGDKLRASTVKETPEFVRKMLEVDVKDLPKEVDWRKVPGRVGPVKDSDWCLANWAFATTGLLEGQQYRFNMTQVVPLSEQNLVDCSDSNYSCQGGYVDEALDDIANIGGIEDEKQYPYTSHSKRDSDDKCKFNKTKSIMTVKGGLLLDGTEETLLKVVAQYGPVATGMRETDNLIFYQWGVYYDPFCTNDPTFMNEPVLIVGYGVDKMQGDYWLVVSTILAP